MNIAGCRVEFDRSGVGHCWVEMEEIRADIELEIEAEIIDGGQEECDDYVASDGCHYRWK